ncbi:MAG: class II fructose-bisphosphate aldolase [Gammaproteobacteria bacterium]|nr:class II fructose-bisphosphate aldolase [Gammaproteobacteria bacterium]
MALVDMREMVRHAYDHHYAVPAFEVECLDLLAGVVIAAEQWQSPFIVTIPAAAVATVDQELLLPAVEAAARKSAVPVAIEYRSGGTVAETITAINRGCNGIAVSVGSPLAQEGRALLTEMVKMATGCGIAIEATIPSDNLDSDTLQQLITTTGVGRLAVAISGASRDGDELAQWRRVEEGLQRLQRSLDLPWGLSCPVAPESAQLQQLITSGVAKVGECGALAAVVTALVRDHLHSLDGENLPDRARIREAVASEAESWMRLTQAAGKAPALLQTVTPWLPVEHLIIFNVEGLDEAGVTAMLHRGREVLSQIAGVREVVTGEAIKEGAAYRYTWLVQFCHPAVIASYRDHPQHVAFADDYFRPVAGERISIDYLWSRA